MRTQLVSPPLEVLDRKSCLELLALDVVGRLAVVVKGAPQITPVNYVLDGEVLVFRSGPGSKLRAAERAPACLEIDHFDVETRTGWSVVATGRLEEITPYQATLLTAAQRLPIDPWAGGPKMHWLRLIPSRITGRRIVTDAQSTSSLGVTTTKAEGPPPPASVARSPSAGGSDNVLFVVYALAAISLIISLVGVGFGIRALDAADAAGGASTSAGAADAGPSGSRTSHPSVGTMTTDDMDKAMAAVTAKFPAKTEGVGAQDLTPTILADGTHQFELTTSNVSWEVEPGRFVDAMAYNGTVPGPTMRVSPGNHVRVVVTNQMRESTAVHFHGIDLPNSMDGVPDITQAPIKPRATFTYEFTAQMTPAVGMYHSHHNAAIQVPDGLAGAFLIGTVPTPGGPADREQVMMLNDAGAIGFSLNGKSFPATAPIAVKLGDRVLVHYINEGVTAHPMHLHGLPQLVVAKDGFPLDQPYRADTVNVAPGERYSVLVEATVPGVWAWHCHILPHAERSTGMFGMVTAMVVE